MMQRFPDYSQTRFDLDAEKARFARDFPDLAERVIILDAQKAQSGEAALKEVRALLGKAVKPKHPLLRRLTPLNERQRLHLEGALSDAAEGRACMRPIRKSYSRDEYHYHAALISPRWFPLGQSQPDSAAYLAAFGHIPLKLFRLDQTVCDAFPPALYAHFTFDHEIAHALYRLEHDGQHIVGKDDQWQHDLNNRFFETLRLEESFCDSYATLRHLQRHGTDDPFPQVMALARIAGAVHPRDYKYYTSQAIDLSMRTARLLAHSGIDFATLPPSRMRDMAAEIAQETAFSAREQSLFRGNWPSIRTYNAEMEIRHMGQMLEARSHFRRYLALNYLRAAETLFPTNAHLAQEISGHLNRFAKNGKDVDRRLQQKAQRIAQRFQPCKHAPKGGLRP